MTHSLDTEAIEKDGYNNIQRATASISRWHTLD